MLLHDFHKILSLNHKGTNIQATLELNKEHVIFQGHFPRNPVVPGVCLMTMIKEVLEQALGTSLTLKEAKSIKFLGVVNPNEQTILQVQCDVVYEESIVKATSLIIAGEQVCYKANALYTTSLHVVNSFGSLSS